MKKLSREFDLVTTERKSKMQLLNNSCRKLLCRKVGTYIET
jgi:hypothetical protein